MALTFPTVILTTLTQLILQRNGKRANKVLKKNSKVKVDGSTIKIKGKLFYSIGNKQYVKKANF